jgi:hypothetical protein
VYLVAYPERATAAVDIACRFRITYLQRIRRVTRVMFGFLTFLSDVSHDDIPASNIDTPNPARFPIYFFDRKMVNPAYFELYPKRSKRLRKKLHVGEFQEFGLAISFTLRNGEVGGRGLAFNTSFSSTSFRQTLMEDVTQEKTYRI